MKIVSETKEIIKSPWFYIPFFIIFIIFGIYSGTKKVKENSIQDDILAKQCALGNNTYRQRIVNNYVNADKIREDFKDCLKGNSNRDVVYNDTNELAKTCKRVAFELNNGINIQDYSGDPTFETLLKIEKNIHDCGGK